MINYFEVPLTEANFAKTKAFERIALITGYKQQILQSFYYKISLGKMVSKQEKGIPEFANTIRACFVFLIIEECS